ncbi:envelope stress response membrane protein PspC [Parasphingorhabdus halotolerans]|uniref:Envelope stress response membrane protein PspC n=1 Tax=Parasphingorhabdus halotolerans TaxID=2725558 RepID=A0A6H2DKR6_9SPHN|nr:envelope stress response membrane protein PspC [Parasphingorhabdus halotolerans]QJB68341.1 envelope stress response membrane protein PspC [Parasphingorhabdus halotolerans]
MTSSRTKFYLDKQRAKWSGVCAGIADYTGINVAWVRFAAIVATVTFAFPWTLIAYWIAAKISDAKPIELYHRDPEELKFWQGVRQSPRRTTRDIKSRFREIDRKLADMELYYTTSNTSLSNEIENLR